MPLSQLPANLLLWNPDLFHVRMISTLCLCIIKHQAVPASTHSIAYDHLPLSSCLVLMELMVALEFWEHLLVIQGDWKTKQTSEYMYCATEKSQTAQSTLLKLLFQLKLLGIYFHRIVLETIPTLFAVSQMF